jgi:glycosyltransferase involved in cell wall biosynthesis
MLLTVIVPVYNEEAVIEVFYQRMKAVIDSTPYDVELLFVNDGSTDSTLEILLSLQKSDSNIKIIDFTRNFGKEVAMTAGLDHADRNADAVVVIDADLQDPPELIPELITKWQDGYDVVYAKRSSREGESIVKKSTSKAFYYILQHVSKVAVPEDTGDFRLMSRRAVDALGTLRERNRFMKGLFAWIGYPQAAVSYHRESRPAGKTKWSYLQLWNLAIDGITSFTVAPLKISTYLGLLSAISAFVYGIWIIIKTIIYGEPVAGYPSMMVVILFLGGVQLFSIGIIGEYLGRIFTESKQRPLYLINHYYQGMDPEEST